MEISDGLAILHFSLERFSLERSVPSTAYWSQTKSPMHYPDTHVLVLFYIKAVYTRL